MATNAKRKDYFREYYAKPEVKARRKDYFREYYAKPEVKEFKKKASQTPGRKELKKKYYADNLFKHLANSAAQRQRQRGHSGWSKPLAEDIEEIWNACGERCEMCDRTIKVLNGAANPDSAQLDCINPNLPYTKNNMAFLCAPCNRLKDKHTLESAELLIEFFRRRT